MCVQRVVVRIREPTAVLCAALIHDSADR